MSKKKREHVTFDRMPDLRVRVSKKAFAVRQERRSKALSAQKSATEPAKSREQLS